MLAIASSIFEPSIDGIDDRVERLLSFDVRRIALVHRMSAREARTLGNAARNTGHTIVALDHDCLATEAELADAVTVRRAQLSALDDNERLAAVARTQRHLELAEELETPTLCVRLGSVVGIDFAVADWHEQYTVGTWRQGNRWQSEDAEHLCHLLLKNRKQHAERHLDRIKKSLDALLAAADAVGIDIAIVNPRHPLAMPDTDELLALHETFEGSRLCNWYDIGHAEYRQQLGVTELPALRLAIRHALAGITLTDGFGLTDGLPPGQGIIPIEEFIGNVVDRRDDRIYAHESERRIPLVIRCHRDIDDAALSAAIEQLRMRGYDGTPPPPCEPFPIIGA